MYRFYKVRLYPNKNQEKAIWDHVRACRFIWNYMLELQNDRFKNGEKHLPYYGMTYLIKDIKAKEEYSWLSNISSGSLGLTCRDLHDAFDLFFRHIHNAPKFKSKKHDRKSFPTRGDRLWFDGKVVKIDKIGKIKYKTDLELPFGTNQKFHSCCVKCECDKYYLSFAVECESQTFNLKDYKMGIDLGVKDLAVIACGDQKIVIPSINKSKKVKSLDKRLRYYQRRLDKKYSHNNKTRTNNSEKLRKKYAKLSRKISNIRKNYIHQVTRSLVDYLPNTVVMETLIVSKMGHDRNLRRMIHDQCFGRFIDYMRYKCENREIMFIQADQYFPSSKICSCCGSIKKDLKLSDRVYSCKECGFTTDRDYNAAINLMRYADYI